MVGMIEQIHGTGLSGITGKTTSQGKNSLFATLMGILGKHTQGSGKGLQQSGLQQTGLQQLGLQQHATLLGKGQTGKDKSLFAMAEKGDTLLTRKHESLLALATKSKHEKKKVDDTAIPLIAVHIITDQTTPIKKAEKAAKMTVDSFAGQMHSKGKLAELDGQAQTKMEQALLSKAASSALKDQPTIQSPVFAKAASSALKDQSTIHLQESDAALQISGKTTVSEHKAVISAQQDSNKVGTPTQLMASADQTLTDSISKLMSNSKDPSTTAENTKIGASTKAEQVSAQMSADTLSTQTNATTGLQEAAASQTQSGKHAQARQNQNSAIISTVTNIAAGSPDTSRTDSGSQSSNSGHHQDGGNIPILAGDSRLAATAQSSHSQFQHYMSDKTAPSMTLFDSMTHIAQSAKKGKTHLDIQLEPANLGKIQISLQSDAAKQLHVHMIVDQPATRQLIDQQLPALKQALAQQGFDLSGFSMGSQDQQSSSGGDQTHGHKGQTGNPHSTGNTLETSNITTTASLNRTTGNAGLSIRI